MPSKTTSELINQNNLEKLDLPLLSRHISRKFTDKRPSAREFNKFVKAEISSFGFIPSDLIALGTLLYTIWSNSTRDAGTGFACDRMFNGDKCRKQLLRAEKRGENIYVWCGRGHETIVPIKKEE